MALPLNIRASILKHSFSAAAVGIPGAFAAHADVPVLVGIWGNMIYNTAKLSNKPLTMDTTKRIATSLGITAGTFASTGKIANSYFAYSGVGTPIAMLLNSSLNGVSTYVIGNAAANVILKDKLEPEDIIKAAIGGLAAAFGNIFPGNGGPNLN